MHSSEQETELSTGFESVLKIYELQGYNIQAVAGGSTHL